MEYLAALIYPSLFSRAADEFDKLVWSYLEAATGLTIPTVDSGEVYGCVLNLPITSLHGLPFQHHLARLPVSKGGLGLRSMSQVSGPAYMGGIEMSLPFFTGEHGLLQGGTRTGHEFWGGLGQTEI